MDSTKPRRTGSGDARVEGESSESLPERLQSMPPELSLRLMQQLDLSTDYKTLCSMLMVSKKLRQYMVYKCALDFRYVVQGPKPQREVNKVARIVVWLMKHASMFRSIDIRSNCKAMPKVDSEWCEFRTMLAPVVDIKVTMLAAKAKATAAAGAGAAPPFNQLSAFSTNLPLGPSLACVMLPSLTQLVLGDLQHTLHSSASRVDGELQLLAAFRQLSNLQHLELSRVQGRSPDHLISQCLSIVPRLKHLTALVVDGVVTVPMLPATLKILRCTFEIQNHVTNSLSALKHLTSLTELQISGVSGCKQTVALPASLRTLDVGCLSGHKVVRKLRILGLKQLQYLSLRNTSDVDVDIASLSELTGLQQVGLAYDFFTSAIAAAAGWRSVASLKSLEVRWAMQRYLVMSVC